MGLRWLLPCTKFVEQAGQRTEIQKQGDVEMKNRLYKIKAEFNDVLENVEDVVNVLKVEIGGIGKIIMK